MSLYSPFEGEKVVVAKNWSRRMHGDHDEVICWITYARDQKNRGRTKCWQGPWPETGWEKHKGTKSYE